MRKAAIAYLIGGSLGLLAGILAFSATPDEWEVFAAIRVGSAGTSANVSSNNNTSGNQARTVPIDSSRAMVERIKSRGYLSKFENVDNLQLIREELMSRSEGGKDRLRLRVLREEENFIHLYFRTRYRDAGLTFMNSLVGNIKKEHDELMSKIADLSLESIKQLESEVAEHESSLKMLGGGTEIKGRTREPGTSTLMEVQTRLALREAISAKLRKISDLKVTLAAPQFVRTEIVIPSSVSPGPVSPALRLYALGGILLGLACALLALQGKEFVSRGTANDTRQ